MISPKKHQPWRSKRVTLIVADRTPEGIVIHADSQETVGNYRVEVDKIKSEVMGEFQVLIAGAGSPGTLVDAFQVRVSRKIKANVTSIEKFASVVEKELVRFYENDVYLCPDDGKCADFLIAVSHPKGRRFEAWITNNIVLQRIPADAPILIGWEEELYKAVARRLYSRGMSTQQSILAGMFLMTLAEESSNFVKSPIKIAAVNEAGITLDETDYHRRIQDRLKAYDRRANQVFLKCADTTVSTPELEDAINDFRKTALDLHRDQIDELARKATLLDPRCQTCMPNAFQIFNKTWNRYFTHCTPISERVSQQRFAVVLKVSKEATENGWRRLSFRNKLTRIRGNCALLIFHRSQFSYILKLAATRE